MAYTNDSGQVSESYPGSSNPISPNLPPTHVLQGLGHNVHAPGSLTSPRFPYYGNYNSRASPFGNNLPMMQIPSFSPYPIADSSFNFNVGGGSGGGSGTDHRTVVSESIDWLQFAVTTDNSPAAGDVEVTYTASLTTDSAFCDAVNACVNSGSFVTYKTWDFNDGSNIVANSSTDNVLIQGDWNSSSSAGAAYIKAVGGSDTVTFSFERFMHERVDTDDDAVITAGQKAAVLKFEGGTGITTSAALFDGSSAGENVDTKVTIAIDNNALDTIQLVRVTSNTTGTITVSGITGITYPVEQLVPAGTSGSPQFSTEQTGTLYDFSKYALNEPNNHTGTNATYTFQTLEENTVLSAKRVHAWGNVWIRGGVATLDFACE